MAASFEKTTIATTLLAMLGAALLGATVAEALGTVVQPIETTTLLIRDPASSPNRRRFRFRSSTRGAVTNVRIVAPERGSDGDPTATGTGLGGELTIYGASGEATAIELPAGDWKRLGSTVRPRGYRFRAADRTHPVQRIKVVGDLISIRGGGGNWNLTLDEAAQGTIGVHLRLGTGFVWCASAAGDVDELGLFKAARRSAAPATCPATLPRTCPAVASAPADSVATREGPIVGTAQGIVRSYRGVPFAAPPTGPLRWRPPAPPRCRAEVLEATDFGPICPQYDAGGMVGDEDCLTLNIWSPDGAAAPLPVMFWIHGGAHQQGAGSLANYDGASLAGQYGVVAVTVNYRLGPFGFLAHPAMTAEGGERASGSFGTLDQIAALEWVRDNIAEFGGDPARVTIFGQSAGSVSACRLIASPRAAGLFHRAILQSGACTATDLVTAEATGAEVLAELGCAAAAEPLACMRAQSTAAVLATLNGDIDGTNSLARNTYDGVIDGYTLPDHPRALIAAGLHNPVPVVVGATADENGRNAPDLNSQAAYEAAVTAFLGFGPTLTQLAVAEYPVSQFDSYRDAYVQLTSDVKFVCSARRDAELISASQAEPVYLYNFDDILDNATPQFATWGAFHGLDTFYAFGTVGLFAFQSGPSDLALADAMQGYWSRFAATGDPNGATAPLWQPYDATFRPFLRLATPAEAGNDFRGPECDFWASISG